MKQVEVSDVQSLIDCLRRNGVGLRPLRVGLDGSYGIGKTTLAYCLACHLSLVYHLPVRVVSVDQFIHRDERQYIDQISPEMNGLCDHYVATGRTFLIEGICLLAVLEKIGLSLDFLIYVRKLNPRSEWADANLYSGALSIEAWTKRIDTLPEVLEKQVAKYHMEYRPFNKAHFVYSVTHNN